MFIPQVAGLVTWAASHGAHIHEKVEIYEDDQYGISLRVRGTGSLSSSDPAEVQVQPANTLRGLPKNSRVVSCPFVLSMSYLNALDVIPDLKAHSPRFPESFFRSIEPQVVGYFFLMQQYLMGEESYWRPYIKSLPQPHEHDKHRTLLYFTVADMQWVRGTNLERARSERESTWRLDWKGGCDILDSHPEWESRKGQWSWELYKWAATIFSSRSFVSNLIPSEILEYLTDDDSSEQGIYTPLRTQYEFPNAQSRPPRHRSELFWHGQTCGANWLRETPFPVLFPLIDLANHSSSAKVTWFTNAHNIPRDLSIILEVDIPEGDQIFNNYGPKSNNELLLGYGFCIPGNDEVAIAFKPPQEDVMALLKLHSCHQKPNAINGGQKVFHIRRSPYPRPPIDKRLPEFAVFEDGCIDTLAVYVANQREKEFMTENPRYCPEKDAEASFSGPLLRNILNVLSVLYGKVQVALNEINKHPDDNIR
jgi:SET domain